VSSDTASALRRFEQYVDGRFVESESGRRFESENPFYGAPWASLPDSSADDVDAAVAAARRAFDVGPWPRMRAQERSRLLRRLADLIDERGAELAELETSDNGKLLSEQRIQWKLLTEVVHYWAGMCDKIDGRALQSPIPISVNGTPFPNAFAYTRREPVGVVGAIIPWNSPGSQLIFKFGPAMAAGCTMVVKPSEHASVSTAAFAQLVHDAGFPAGVFNVVTSCDRNVGAYLASHPGIDKVSFTGSTATGRSILHSAADNVTRVTAELGGKSAIIVFDDAELPKAIFATVAGLFAASGQTCMAGSRILVHESIHDAYVEALTATVATLKVGDPKDLSSNLGPISNRPNFEKVMRYIEIGKAEGARLVTGGRQPEDLGGYFVEPTVFADVTPDMQIASDEIFGPVASVMKFDNEDEAVRIANATPYGLAAGVITSNAARGHRVAHQLRAGTVWINTYRLVTQLAPFGGYKASGIGREGSAEALEPYLETKAVWVPLD
jgi:(Z)-2-((N-methylformamido)methylene)-5-hydroxybutyrolactone dehydrogenase